MSLAAARFSGAGVELAADLAGPEDGAPVVFLPGGGQTRHAWKGAVERVGESGLRAVSLDLRGHGESGWAPDGNYGLEAFVADLRAVLAELGRPAFLVGASLGGLTSLVTAARDPRVHGLVLVDVAPRIETKGAEHIRAFMLSAPDGFADLEEAADAVAGYMPHRTRPKDVSGLMKNLREGEDGRLRWHWDPRFGGREISSSEFLTNVTALEDAARALRVPTLLVRGGLSEVVSLDGVAAFKALAPDAEVVDIAGADHMVAGDRNDAFNDAVIGFLLRHATETPMTAELKPPS